MANQDAAVADILAKEVQEDTEERGRSTIDFPYLDLDAAVEIAKGVHHFGSTCSWDQLAAQLGQAPKGGGFRLRVMTAKTFGLVTYAQQTVSLTRLGMQICDETQESAAKAEAFLMVPLYSAVYEKFKGVSLPGIDGLETEITNMGVAPKQKGKARQAFQRSATQAGYFWSGPNRLVKPAIQGSAAPAAAPEVQPEKPEKKRRDADEDGEPRHPLIEGLLKELPKPQAEWTTEDRKKWLQMASTIFDVIYKDSDDSRGSLKVVVERNSAKS